ncbi:MAG: methyltransferase domain-containing protein [Oscillochloris sp.]|nr:methyltransferase domain-containing protein [Oscillochloris sp.]
MVPHTINADQARQFYDRLGAGHDRAEWYEGAAKLRGLELLDLQPRQHVLSLGVGTGKEHLLISETIGWRGLAVGLDLSPVMLNIAAWLTRTPQVRADVRSIPLADASFDRVYSSYLLDLIALDELPVVLAAIRRVLRPGGRAVLVSLTEGVNPLSRSVIGAWKLAFRINPMLCGGCRPLELADLARQAGLHLLHREVVVQAGMPSEVLVCAR